MHEVERRMWKNLELCYCLVDMVIRSAPTGVTRHRVYSEDPLMGPSAYFSLIPFYNYW